MSRSMLQRANMYSDKKAERDGGLVLTMGMSLSTLRIMSTAAWSAEFLSPLPSLAGSSSSSSIKSGKAAQAGAGRELGKLV